MTDTILPHEIPLALERASQVKVLSLDCFDTLLWRDVHRPDGVFDALEGLGRGQRIVGEANARKSMRALRRKNEVTVEQIYAAAMPSASPADLASAVDGELKAEARCCFAFAPTVALMRAAKAKGIPVVIASDTYLSAAQLGELIKVAAGQEVRDLIEQIYCSSQIGISKAEGMLAHVLKKLKCNPADVLHIGDNPKADYDAARALGIPALHLVQFAEETKQRLRLEAAMADMVAAPSGNPTSLQPHRAIMAADEPEIDDAAIALGFSALGPVFHGFNAWLEAEAADLTKARGGTVHWLFLMRDGHLPMAVHRASRASEAGHPAEISRFVAIAASLTDKAAIERHAAAELGLKPETLARQMLMDEDEIAALNLSDDHREAALELHKELMKGSRQKLIQRRSRAMARRLVQHIRKACNPAKGDTLMLVDLGYNGSAQNRVDALLQKELGVHVAGRYLLLREKEAPRLDKKGLIDERNFRPSFLTALSANVALLEQLSTTTVGSVVDFTENGEPIRGRVSVKGAQSAVRDTVQAGCIRFAQKAREGQQIRRANYYDASAWRDGACAALTRLLYFPQPRELKVVREFEHDVNLGSDRMVALFDPEIAQEGLRRRGLFYMNGSERMYLPAELAQEDMSLRLSLFTQKAFGLGFTYTDSAKVSLDLPVIYLAGEKAVPQTASAMPTHDGYYSLRLPIGKSQYAVAVQFGACFDWVEVRSASAMPVESLKEGGLVDTAPVTLACNLDEIEERAAGLYQCESEAGVVLIHPPVQTGETAEEMVAEIVFRPIVSRAKPAGVVSGKATNLGAEAA